MRRHAVVALLAALVYLLVIGLADVTISNAGVATPAAAMTPEQPTPSAKPATTSPSPSSTSSALPEPPVVIRNVVLILADDLDTQLFDSIPRLAALKSEGLTFTQQTVTDSLCCPSRVSMMRSQYVHNHKVVSNTEETGGGWPVFRDLGEQKDCLPVWLSDAGVNTAFMGKYLNEYPADPEENKLIPPGWDHWVVPVSRGESYKGYNYTLNIDGTLIPYGDAPDDFLNDVLTEKAVEFIDAASSPFFLQVSVYNPHQPAPVAERHRALYRDQRAPRTSAYNVAGVDGPRWQAKRKAIKPWKLAKLDRLWQKRMRSAESIADTVEAVRGALRASGRDQDTLVIVTSDNGYHVASHRLSKGKRTPYRVDTIVPMVMLGPGIVPGSQIGQMTSGIDLAPTITELLGAKSPGWIDGRSLVPFVRTSLPQPGWRDAILSESVGDSDANDPDSEVFSPPHFEALRTPQWLYVEYETGERALYDLVADPDELVNVVDSADQAMVARFAAQLAALRTCSGPACRVADRLPD